MKLHFASLLVLAVETCLGDKKDTFGTKAGSEPFSAMTNGFAAPLIVGGTPVIDSDTRYPWFAKFHGCGGQLIAEEWVLTAAHCAGAVRDTVEIGRISLRDGDNNYNQELITVGVDSFTPHPEYVSASIGRDFALVKLNAAIASIEPVPIDTEGYSNTLTSDDKLWAIGLGTLSSGGSAPEELMHVEVSYVTNDQCDADYANHDITEDMMCAADPGQDSCQGDSGGPLWDKGQNLLVGVVSWGIGCARPEYPGVYGRVSEVADWISNVMNPQPTEPPTSAPTVDCTGKSVFRLTLKTDQYGSETGFTLEYPGNSTWVMPQPLGSGTEVNYSPRCLDPGEYKFTITDSYGDGICCSYGAGFYKIDLDGVEIANGGQFGASESVTFTVEAGTPPPNTPTTPPPVPTTPPPVSTNYPSDTPTLNPPVPTTPPPVSTTPPPVSTTPPPVSTNYPSDTPTLNPPTSPSDPPPQCELIVSKSEGCSTWKIEFVE